MSVISTQKPTKRHTNFITPITLLSIPRVRMNVLISSVLLNDYLCLLKIKRYKY